MAPTRDWEGDVRLNIAAGPAGGKRRQVLLPIPWQCDQVDEIRDAVVYVFDEFQKGVDPDLCVARIHRLHHAGTGAGSAAEAPAAALTIEDWSELIEAFRDCK
jgi:hypothetical protein